MIKKTKPIRIADSTIAKLDKIGEEICKEMGIKDPTYTQIIEYVLNKLESKNK
jgi:hypothetical protein